MNKEEEKRLVAQTMYLVKVLQKIAETSPLDDPIQKLGGDYASAYGALWNRLREVR